MHGAQTDDGVRKVTPGIPSPISIPFNTTGLASDSKWLGVLRLFWCFPTEAVYGRMARLPRNRAHLSINLISSHLENMTTSALLSENNVMKAVMALGMTDSIPNTPRELFVPEGLHSRVGSSLNVNLAPYRSLKAELSSFTTISSLVAAVSYRNGLTANSRTVRTKERCTKQNPISSFFMYKKPDTHRFVLENHEAKSLYVQLGRVLGLYACEFKVRKKSEDGTRHTFSPIIS